MYINLHLITFVNNQYIICDDGCVVVMETVNNNLLNRLSPSLFFFFFSPCIICINRVIEISQGALVINSIVIQ